MGNQLGGTAAATVTPTEQLPPIRLSPEELRSYENACENDHDVRKFDMELQARTNRALNALAAGLNQPNSFSLDVLREITGCLLETDQRVAEDILASKNDIWKNRELFSLVDDYFKTSLKTLDFCIALEKCLTNARDKHTILRAALRIIEEAKPGQDVYKKAMEDLRRFRSDETHFTEELLELFGTVYCQHLQMLKRLQDQRIQLEKKLKRVKSLRKTANIIFVAAFASVLICSVVAAALAAPPIVTAMVTAAAAAATFAPTDRWFKKLWKGFEGAVQEQKEVVSSMQAGTLVVIRDLDNIRVLVEKLEMEMMNSLSQIDDSLAVEEGNGVCLAIQEIVIKVGIFTRNVDELGEYVDCCSRNIHQARAVVSQTITRAPR